MNNKKIYAKNYITGHGGSKGEYKCPLYLSHLVIPVPVSYNFSQKIKMLKGEGTYDKSDRQ